MRASEFSVGASLRDREIFRKIVLQTHINKTFLNERMILYVMLIYALANETVNY